MKRFMEIVLAHQPVNFGDMKTGNIFRKPVEEIIDQIQDTSIVHAVFNDRDTIIKVLEELVEANLGMSVNVSGLSKDTEDCCRKVGLKVHTIEHSLGIHGKTSKLPEEPVLEITTMCGHGMVAANLVKKMAEDIRKGKKSLTEAAQMLAGPCHCGVFNVARAQRLLQVLAGN
ncbi:MAG: hypothetical protein ACYC38_13065 [Eubacteriales bacterium]